MKNFLPIFGFILGCIIFPIISPAHDHTQAVPINNSSHDKLSDKADAGWINGAVKSLSESEYYFQQKTGNTFAAINRKQQAGFFVTTNKLTAQSIAFNKSSPCW